MGKVRKVSARPASLAKWEQVYNLFLPQNAKKVMIIAREDLNLPNISNENVMLNVACFGIDRGAIRQHHSEYCGERIVASIPFLPFSKSTFDSIISVDFFLAMPT